MTERAAPLALLSLAGATLVALTLGGLALHLPGAATVGSPSRKAAFVALLALAATVYFVAVGVVLRRPWTKHALWAVLAVAAVLRLSVLFAPPFLSSDMYRYVWDGRVQVAGINPYRYIPDDPALTSLRDATVFPNINRADYAHTIYPPAAQIVFAVVARIDDSVLAMKLAMAGFEALAAWSVLRLLHLARLPPERLLIYAWNPLAVWSFAGNGHVDAIEVGLLALTLLLAATRRPALGGIAFGATVLVKFLPIVLAPALWRRMPNWRLPAFAAVSIVVLYACYASVGWGVFGFLSSYTREEGLRNGTGVWLLGGLQHLAPLPPIAGRLYLFAVAVALVVLGLRVAFAARHAASRQDCIVQLCGDVAILAAAVTVAISPHYPWYFPWLALPCCVAPRHAVIWLSAGPVLLYLNPWQEVFFWPCLVYLPAAALALREWRQQRTRLATAGAVERNA